MTSAFFGSRYFIQEPAVHKIREVSSWLSGSKAAAQFVMVPMAMLVGAKADAWGRKPLFLAGFLILPIRGLLYVLSDNPYWLVGVQLLDGVGAGIFGVLWGIIISDLAKGTGRFNLLQGAIQSALGVGAFLSNFLSGFVVKHLGHNAGFLGLAGIAVAGLVFFALIMPETKDHSAPTNAPKAPLRAPPAPA